MLSFKISAFADEASPFIDGQIAAMRRNGVAALEVRQVDGENVSDISLAKAAEVGKKLGDAGLSVWAVGSPIGKIDLLEGDFPAELDRLRHTIDLADALGTRNIRMFSFYTPKGEDPAAHRGQVLDRLGRMAEIAREGGATLCHENEKGIYGDTPERCADIHAQIPEIAGVFDPANYIQCGQDPWRAWTLVRRWIRYMHVKDADAAGRVVPVGEGVGQLPRLLEAYAAQGGEWLSVEPHLKVFDGLSALEREGERTEPGARVYPTSDAAFDAACRALRALIG